MKLLILPIVAAALVAKGIVVGVGLGAAAGGLAACACRRGRRRSTTDEAAPVTEAS